MTNFEFTNTLNSEELIGLNGLTVRLTSAVMSDLGNGYKNYRFEYLEVNKTSVAIPQASFKLFFLNGDSENQYGFFNDVLPGENFAERGYFSVNIPSNYQPSILQYDDDHFFEDSPKVNALQWAFDGNALVPQYGDEPVYESETGAPNEPEIVTPDEESSDKGDAEPDESDSGRDGSWTEVSVERIIVNVNDEQVGSALDSRSEYFRGGQDLDSVSFTGARASYDISITAGEAYIRPSGSSNIDLLVNVERANFSDSSLAFDFDGNAGQAYRIYKAAFDRDPMSNDTSGLGFWISQIDNGMDMVEVAARFIDSPEFRALYGQNPTNGEFLNKVYLNVLDRLPDSGGYSWWIDQLNNNPEKTWQKVLADFSESPENQSNVAELIANGIVFDPWVG
jgi:hypothetical protein